MLPKLELFTYDEIFTRQINNDGIKHKLNIFIDMDETLLRSNILKGFDIDDIYQKEISKGNIKLTKSYLFSTRPYAYFFLTQLKKFANLYIFSAGTKPYVDELINKVDPKQELFMGRYYRRSTTGKNMVKDLEKIGFSNKNSILIDNNPMSFTLNGNGIFISDHDCMLRHDDALLLEIIYPLYVCSTLGVKKGMKKLDKKYRVPKSYIQMIRNY